MVHVVRHPHGPVEPVDPVPPHEGLFLDQDTHRHARVDLPPPPRRQPLPVAPAHDTDDGVYVGGLGYTLESRRSVGSSSSPTTLHRDGGLRQILHTSGVHLGRWVAVSDLGLFLGLPRVSGRRGGRSVGALTGPLCGPHRPRPVPRVTSGEVGPGGEIRLRRYPRGAEECLGGPHRRYPRVSGVQNGVHSGTTPGPRNGGC